MVAKEELLMLKTKILPTGANTLLDLLASRHAQVEVTQIVLENVPLVIVGRHGMIARIPVQGTLQKISKPHEILEHLRQFLQRADKLYLFINLPDLPVPTEVLQLIDEVAQHTSEIEHLKRVIDDALDARDRTTFLQATEQLRKLL